MSETRLKVAEIFGSLQGEGERLGTPSTFVRLSGCNLRCVWCDTPYASWSPEGPMMSMTEITEQVDRLGHRDVVLTGGEPMMFSGVEELVDLFRRQGRFVTIETAGTVFRDLDAQLMSISPKLANSTPVDDPKWSALHDQRRKDLGPLRQLVARYDYQLKFVIGESATDDLAEIDAILYEVGPVPPDRVFLMPEGRSSEALWGKSRELVPLLLSRGYRLAPRIQIDLFGDKRGT